MVQKGHQFEISTNQWDSYHVIEGHIQEHQGKHMCVHFNDSLQNCSCFYHYYELQASPKLQK